MKKLNWITGVCCAMMVVLTAVSSLCGETYRMATDAFFYGGMSRMAVMDTLGVAEAADVSAQITAYIGMDDAEQKRLATDLAAFMAQETDALPAYALNDKELQHMMDVRNLVAPLQKVSQALTTLCAALAIVAAWTGAKGSRRSMLIGTLAGVSIVAACAGAIWLALNTSGFEALFVGMHELLFTNDLWLLDPRTDVLIRMMPQLLFERAAAEIVRRAVRTFAVTWAMLCAVYVLVGGMIRRNLNKRDET